MGVSRTVCLEDAPQPRTLIADDQPDVREALRLLLKSHGHQIEAVGSPAAVLDALRAREFDLLLMDLNYARDTTSGAEGLELLDEIQMLDSTLPIVVMTAWGNTELAVEAMQRGACDFVEKPWENARLLAKIRRPLSQSRPQRRVPRLMPSELGEAREVQRGLLPREFPRIDGIEFAVEWRPQGAVSGDSFELLPTPGGAAIAIADAVGKGVPAALLMSHLQAAVRALAPAAIAPRELVARVNDVVCDRVAHGRFITFFYASLDARTLRYTNAGHPAPIVMRRDASIVRLSEGGPVLGEFPGRRYDQGEIRLLPGDRVVFCTDGVLEAENSRGDEFGDENLCAALRENRELGADALRGKLMDAVLRHSGGQLKDDATLIVVGVE